MSSLYYDAVQESGEEEEDEVEEVPVQAEREVADALIEAEAEEDASDDDEEEEEVDEETAEDGSSSDDSDVIAAIALETKEKKLKLDPSYKPDGVRISPRRNKGQRPQYYKPRYLFMYYFCD